MADSAPSSPYHRNLDRLSNLPEHILLHILSFLPTKDAVKASVLSKPWQHLWTLVPAIDLCYVSCPKDFDYSLLISKVLDGDKSPIILRFRLGGRYFSTSYLGKWVSYATERNVEELDLDLDLGDVPNDVEPSVLFRFAPESCKTLVIMKVTMTITFLSRGSHFLIGGHIYFPSLKILHLKEVGFESLDPSLSGFFSSDRFPLLEELVIVVGRNSYSHDLNISPPKLRRLDIESVRKYTLNIEAPSLQYLVLRYFHTRGFRVGNLHNLVETKVDISYNEVEESSMKKIDDEYGDSLINFMNALSNVRLLNLSDHMMQRLSSHSLFLKDRMKPFRNLVELDLRLLGSVLSILMVLLSKFENLQHLKIIEYSDKYDKTEHSLTPPTDVPKCLTHHLKTFCFRYFNCSKYETEFTIYILKNSLVLKNVKIRFRPRLVWQKGHDCQTILLAASRGSLECRLEFGQEHCYTRANTWF